MPCFIALAGIIISMSFKSTRSLVAKITDVAFPGAIHAARLSILEAVYLLAADLFLFVIEFSFSP